MAYVNSIISRADVIGRSHGGRTMQTRDACVRFKTECDQYAYAHL